MLRPQQEAQVEGAGWGLSVPDWLSAQTILEGLKTGFIGREVVYLREVGSTNDEARRLARAGAPEGTLVIAEYQRSGRGRLGRRWEAPPGSCLLLSLVFRPLLAPNQVQRLTMVCGLAVADAVESETGVKVGLKWPNDVMLGGAKAGGILTELELDGDRLSFVVVGIGLNVNLDPGRLPVDLIAPATSLSRVLAREVPRLPVLWALLGAVEGRYVRLRAGHSPQAEWAERLVTLGRPVTVCSSGSVLEGLAEDVDANGALQVRLADGRLETILAGDVSLRDP